MAIHQLQWKPDQPAELRILGNGAQAPVAARILELSGKRLRVRAASQVACGAAVRLDWGGQLVLGVVLDIQPDGLWVEIHHTLLDMPALDWQKQGWRG